MNKKILLATLVFSFAFVSTNVLASLTVGSTGLTGTENFIIDVGAGNSLSLQGTNNGNVGVGVVTPASKLEVNGSIRIKSGSEGQLIFADGSTMSTAGLGSASSLSDAADAIITGDSDASGAGTVILKTGANERMRILNSGFVGIGTATPDAKFTLSANAAALQGYSLTGTVMHVGNVDGSNSRILLDSYGNGFPVITFRSAKGTAASPTASTSGGFLMNISVQGYGATGYLPASPAYSKTTIAAYASENWTDTAQGTYLTFWTSPNGAYTTVERMRVDNAGNVGIGTTSATSTLQVAQTTVGVGTVTTNGTTTLTGSNTQFLNTFKVGDTITVTGETSRTIATVDSNTSLTSTVAFSTSGSAKAYTLVGGTRFAVLGNGNIGIGTTTPSAKLDINSDSIILQTAKTPASASETCTTGTIAWDTGYMYVCTATDTWKRSALSTW